MNGVESAKKGAKKGMMNGMAEPAKKGKKSKMPEPESEEEEEEDEDEEEEVCWQTNLPASLCLLISGVRR